jgi:hypothetical protein
MTGLGSVRQYDICDDPGWALDDPCPAFISTSSLYYFYFTINNKLPAAYFDLYRDAIDYPVNCVPTLTGVVGDWFLMELAYSAPDALDEQANILAMPGASNLGTASYTGSPGANFYLSGPFSDPSTPSFPYPIGGALYVVPGLQGPAGAVYQFVSDNSVGPHGVGFHLPPKTAGSAQTIGAYIGAGT